MNYTNVTKEPTSPHGRSNKKNELIHLSLKTRAVAIGNYLISKAMVFIKKTSAFSRKLNGMNQPALHEPRAETGIVTPNFSKGFQPNFLRHEKGE